MAVTLVPTLRSSRSAGRVQEISGLLVSSTRGTKASVRKIEQKTPGNLELEAWAALRRVLDIIEAAKVDGDPRVHLCGDRGGHARRMATPVQLPAPSKAGKYSPAKPGPLGIGPFKAAIVVADATPVLWAT